MSGGCNRCATYGSPAQRLAKARWIAEMLADGAVAERIQIKSKCFDLETRVRILESDLRMSKQNVENYMRLWNSASNEARTLRSQVSVLLKRRKAK
jgi:hypothetical protein